MKVRIKNFQSIKDIELEIDGFTVLVGRNNIGKSAIRRAINGALHNTPGQQFVREGTKDTVVEILTDDLNIVWKKGKTFNGYEINGEEYKRVGRGAPPEIAKAGFRPLSLSNGEKINPQFSETHAPVFLMDKSGMVVAELISSVSRLSVLNSATRFADKDMREVRSRQKVREADVKLIDQKLSVLEDLPSLLDLNKNCQQRWKTVETLVGEQKEIGGFQTEMASLKEAISILEVVEDVTIPSDNFKEILDELREVTQYVDQLQDYKSQITLLKPVSSLEIPSPSFEQVEELTQINVWVEEMEALARDVKKLINVDDIELPTIDEMIAKELDGLSELFEEHEKVTGEIEKLEEAGVLKQEELDKLEAQLHEEIGDLDLCPLCNNKIVN